MAEATRMEVYARKVSRDAAIARRRSLVRRAAWPLVRKYIEVVPSVFTARGQFAVFRLEVPVEEALDRLRDRAVLTLDSATEILGGFRFGRGGHAYAYFPSASDLEAVSRSGLGARFREPSLVHGWAAPESAMLFAVVPASLPPLTSEGGFRIVSREHLVRDLIGFYGPRVDLLARIEAHLK